MGGADALLSRSRLTSDLANAAVCHQICARHVRTLVRSEKDSRIRNFHGLGKAADRDHVAVTKAATRAYARTWAAELKGRGIRVNTLGPGVTDTPILDSQSETAGRDEVVKMYLEGWATPPPTLSHIFLAALSLVTVPSRLNP
jgi:NAD(P)-dependent dehydrogenase (short-subunit alcohol dehydrogenase family)